MKKTALAAAIVLIAGNITAQVTLAEHITQLREAQSRSRIESGVHESVINVDGAASAFLFPAAGSSRAPTERSFDQTFRWSTICRPIN